MSVERTPLQTWTHALHDLLADARDALTDEQYQAFVFVGIEQLRRAGAELVVLEAEDMTAEGES